MTYLLDTNVIVDLTGSRGTSIRIKLEEVGLAAIAISAITLAEIEYGAARVAQPSRTLSLYRQFLMEIPVLPFDQSAAAVYGRCRADLERAGRMIGGNDLMIAAVALSQNLILVTRDVSEFERVPGLPIENWSS